MNKIKFIFLIVSSLWIIHMIDWIIPIEIKSYGIIPRSSRGLIGIILSPFLHANIYHLSSNTIPLIILGLVLVSFYQKIALQVMIVIILFGGGLVWVIARSANHIGASGLIYGLVAFLIAIGILNKDLKSILISLVIAFTYGFSMFFGILPIYSYVSWEGHLFGAVAGIMTAYIFRKQANLHHQSINHRP